MVAFEMHTERRLPHGGKAPHPRETKMLDTPTTQAARKPLVDSDKVQGTDVYDANGTKIGSIDRLLIEKVSGKVVYAIMSFGGFLGMGSEEYAIPWNKLDYDTRFGGYRTDITEKQLKGSPTFYREPKYEWGNAKREREIFDYWSMPAYWD
jgi:sporulation protein YlmC with PRC-barrel domain